MPELTWIGKNAVANHHLEVKFRLLNDEPELSCGDAGSGNLIVQGDNLLALKALLPYYAGKVKCIYIDPPYNTGNEGWVYNDNVKSPIIREWLNKVVGKESEDLTRHDKWLCMMMPRLQLLKKFLREDGSIWISMDDNEVASLRFVLDEIFGAQNFVTQVEWQKRYTRSNNTVGFTTVVEHIVVYRKSGTFTPNLELKDERADARYRNPDNDPRGAWKAIPFLNPLSPRERPNLCYDILQPNTGKLLKNTTKAWRASKETFEKYVVENRLWWGSSGSSDTPNIKRFLAEVRRGMPPINFWSYDVAGHTDTANSEVKELFGEKIFDTPKPTQLLKRILEHATNPGDLILDSFAGSGTTGHAVLKLNEAANHEAQRNFILVEMEPNIAREITTERARRVANGYTNAKGELIKGLGGGFRFCTLGEELFDATGKVRESVTFSELARHVYFTETGEPLTTKLTTNSPATSPIANSENTLTTNTSPAESAANSSKKNSLTTKSANAAKSESADSLNANAVGSLTAKSPLIGITANGVAVYLLFNGILGDKSANGGNILTRAVLAKLPPHDGQRVIYCAGCLLGRERLLAERIVIRQTPYEIKTS